MKRELYRMHFSTIDSTNSFAKNTYQNLDREKLTLITANFQRFGRGRHAREWISPPGKNLLATYCFFVAADSQYLTNTAQVTALTLATTLEKFGFFPKIKWPNDILLSNKKVAGILCEMVPIDNQILAIVGLGLNVNWPNDKLVKIGQPITSLLLEKGCEMSLEELISAFSIEFQNALESFLKQGFSPFLSRYVQYLNCQPGQMIRFHNQGCTLEGIFHSLSSDGAIKLILEGGKIKRFYTFD